MADYTTGQTSGNGGWIIGAIVVGLIVLFLVFAGNAPPPGDATTTGEPAVLVPPSPVASE